MKYLVYPAVMLSDILILLFLLMTEQYMVVILLIHAVLIFTGWKIYKTFDTEFEILPYYILFFMPILGIFIFHILTISLHYFMRNSDVIDDYEQILLEEKLNERKRVDYDEEMRTMSFLDLFPTIDNERKKQVLIDSHYSYDINNSKILLQGLESDDMEVQHYSATLLNSLENDFTNTISSLREQYTLYGDDAALDELIISYRSYLNSSLIGEESIQLFKKEYVDLLLQKVNRNRYDREVLQYLFTAFIEIDDYYHATLINHRIEEEYGKDCASIVNKIHIQFNQGYIKEVVDLLLSIDLEQCKDEPKIQQLYDFFSIGG